MCTHTLPPLPSPPLPPSPPPSLPPFLPPSGCEGDDEESSVEGMGKLIGLFEKESSSTGTSSEDEEKLTQILNGAFPMMSESGQARFENHLQSLPEFKHPGRFGINGRSGRKKRCKPSQLTNSLTLKEINTKIVNFIKQTTEVELKFELISCALCRTISSLAKVYNLECATEQRRRLPVASPRLRKTLLTRLATKAEVEPILRTHGRESPTTNLQTRTPPTFQNGSSTQHQQQQQAGISSRSHSGNSHSHSMRVVVGGQIPALDDSNIGKRMLQGMGWTPGMGLGAQENGIMEPVVAEMRSKHHGLGY